MMNEEPMMAFGAFGTPPDNLQQFIADTIRNDHRSTIVIDISIFIDDLILLGELNHGEPYLLNETLLPNPVPTPIPVAVPIPAPTPTSQALAPPPAQAVAENIGDPSDDHSEASNLVSEAVVVDPDFAFPDHGIQDIAQSFAPHDSETNSSNLPWVVNENGLYKMNEFSALAGKFFTK